MTTNLQRFKIARYCLLSSLLMLTLAINIRAQNLVPVSDYQGLFEVHDKARGEVCASAAAYEGVVCLQYNGQVAEFAQRQAERMARTRNVLNSSQAERSNHLIESLGGKVSYGENLWYGESLFLARMDDNEILREAAQSWYDERQYYRSYGENAPRYFSSSCIGGPCGQYAHMISKDAELIGCGVARAEGTLAIYVSCNYARQGLYFNRPLYSCNTSISAAEAETFSCTRVTLNARDTTVCIGAAVDLFTLVEGDFMDELTFINIETSAVIEGIVQANETTTFSVLLGPEGVNGTAEIKVNVTQTPCLLSFKSDNGLQFDDPCDCDQVEQEVYFRDVLVIEAVAGQQITFSTQGAADFYSAPGVPMSDGTPIVEETDGIYKLEFYKLSEAQAAGSVRLNGGTPVPILPAALEVCFISDCLSPSVDLPVFGKYGIAVMISLLVMLGLMALKWMKH